MKRLATIFLAAIAIALTAGAQIVQPIKWTGTIEGDSVKLIASIEQGWHLNIIELGDGFYMDEYEGTFTETIAKADTIRVRFNACDDKMCTAPETWEFVAASDEVQSERAEDDNEQSIWWVFVMGLLGGLLAIFTPCVWPIIPMTVSFFIKRGGAAKGTTNATVVRDAILYGMSIVIIYVGLGLLVTLVFGASALNALSTNAVVNIIFFLILVLFAASFFGAFEITLPSSWSTALNSKSSNTTGFLSILLMAFTLVVVSFSCTGPIVGSVLIQSTSGEFWQPIVTMFAFSLAFALPFTLFALFPSLLKNLPKSGGWLNSVKVVLGFVEVALGFKFLSVADQVYHWNLLDREIYLAIWIVVFSLLGLYLLGKIKFAHDSELKHLSVGRLALAIGVFTFVVYMIPGMWGAPLKALSGYMPPLSSQDFVIEKYAPAAATTTSSESDINNPKYGDFLHLPHGLKGFFDMKEAEAYAQKVGKPIFIDFTGHGCVNCREMEARVWADPTVQQILRDEYVIVALYTDDKMKLEKSDWVTAKNGDVLKTLGAINANYALTRFGVNAQPYYVLQGKKGAILGDPRGYDLSVEGFVEFLRKGVEEFNK